MPTTASRKIEDGCATVKKPRPSSKNMEEITQPKSYSSCSDWENHADIKPVMLKRNTHRMDNKPQRDKINQQRASSQNSSGYGGVNSYRSRRGIGTSTSQDSDAKSKKNSSEAEHFKIPSKVSENSFRKENPEKKKKKKTLYGRNSQPRSQNIKSSQRRSSNTSQTSLRQKIKRIDLPLYDSEKSEKSDEEVSAFKPPSSEFLDFECSQSPETNSLIDSFWKSAHSSCTSSPVAKRKLFNGSTTAIVEDDLPIPKFKLHKVLDQNPQSSFNDPSSSSMTYFHKSENKVIEDRTKLCFKACSDLDFDDDVPTSSDKTTRSFDTEPSDEFPSKSSTARCPMCNEPVSPAELRSRGNMNTRRQEKFCLAHRKKSAKKEWELNRYPHINWNDLNDRVSKHHLFLRNLINGEDSYYRKLLQDKIDQGKERNLRTTTTNLLPGYYGPRGLRIISENVFHKFTPLLKKRIIQDRLISARGYTPYVQSVLVPEVAVLLIQEDMAISLSEARKVMIKSAAVGELLNDEALDDFQTLSPRNFFDGQSSSE